MKGKIKMTGSSAKKIKTEEKQITMTVHAKKDTLIMQRLAGAAMLIFAGAGMFMGGEASAAVVLTPMALAAVLSKRKLLDFGIF